MVRCVEYVRVWANSLVVHAEPQFLLVRLWEDTEYVAALFFAPQKEEGPRPHHGLPDCLGWCSVPGEPLLKAVGTGISLFCC